MHGIKATEVLERYLIGKKCAILITSPSHQQTKRNRKRIQHHPKPHKPEPPTDTKTRRNRTGNLQTMVCGF